MTTPDRFRRIEEIFHRAADLPAEERARLVGEGLEHEEREIARMTRNAKDAQSAPGPFASFADFRAFRDSAFGRWLDARLSAEPEQADVVHDLLAHLAERMIEMHKQKQVEVRGFLAATHDRWQLMQIAEQQKPHAAERLLRAPPVDAQ